MRASVRVWTARYRAQEPQEEGYHASGEGRAHYGARCWEEQYARFYVRVDTAVVVVHEAGIEAKREGVDVVGSPAPHADEEPLGVVEERVELHAHVHPGIYRVRRI